MDNLIPVTERTKNEAREISRKGGKASGESRRRRASMREALTVILSAPVKDKTLKAELKASGAVEMNANSLLALRLYQQAINGDTKAARLVLQAIGEADPATLEIADTKLDLEYLRLGAGVAICDPKPNTNFIEALNTNAADFFSNADEMIQLSDDADPPTTDKIK
jgi:hypothetical protein